MVDLERLERYAHVITTIGLRARPGDRLFIQADREQALLVQAVARGAYGAGMLSVDVWWVDTEVERARFTHGTPEAHADVSAEAAALNHATERGASFLRIDGRDPDRLASVDPDAVAKQARVFGAAARPFMEARSNLRNIWSVAAAAGPTWARRVFPELDEIDATEQLWDAIMTVNRVDEPDPILAWEQHVLELERRSAHLNDKRYDRLLYRGPGTDLTLGLPRGHVWMGGSAGQRRSVPNIPTEEVFTAPDRMRADGVVRATKPLSYSGSLIDDFELRFEAGVVAASRAGVGQDVLDRLLTFDQGSVRLGEAALVPQSSLVSQQNLVWQNTLFDENDGCHIALGMAYPVCLDGGPEMNADERTAAGLNQSDTHVDFVIGSAELDIYGITEDGREEPLLLGGEWAFDT